MNENTYRCVDGIYLIFNHMTTQRGRNFKILKCLVLPIRSMKAYEVYTYTIH